MRFARFALLAPLVAALAACSGDATTSPAVPKVVVPAAPVAIINDGSRPGGNPNFFFLPPLVLPPIFDPDFDAGKANTSWKPIVQLCRLGANVAAGCVTPWLRTYQGSEVAVSVSERSYYVSWNTKEAWATPATYRARVAVVGKDTVTLGFIDLAVLTNLRGIVSLITNDIIPVPDNFTIPIRFRIEDGALASRASADFVETTVSNAGATVRSIDQTTGLPGGAIIQFNPGWLGTQATQVNVVVERLNSAAQPGDPCRVSVPNLIHSSDCWRVTTFPSIATVHANVDLGFCPSLAPTSPIYQAQTMFKYDAGVPSRLRELPNVAAPAGFTCPTAIGALQREPGMLGALQYGLASIGRGLSTAFGPNTAYAIDLGWGGRIPAETDAFSDFFWGIPLRVDVVNGNGQSGVAGSQLTAPLQVRVTGAHVHASESDGPIPIPGVAVTFTPGAGSVGASSVVTGGDGLASTTWTLGSTVGAQSLTASVVSVGTNLSTTFNATAQPPITVSIYDGDNNITGTTQNIVAGNTRSLVLSVIGTTGCFMTSGDTDVLTVIDNDNGGFLVYAQNPGNAVVMVRCGENSTVLATASFHVTAPVITSITVIHGGENVVPATNQVTLFVGFDEPFVVHPYAGSGEVTSQACTFNLVNPPTVAYTSISAVGATSATISANVASGSGSSTLQVTCGAVTRNISIFTTPPIG